MSLFFQSHNWRSKLILFFSSLDSLFLIALVNEYVVFQRWHVIQHSMLTWEPFCFMKVPMIFISSCLIWWYNTPTHPINGWLITISRGRRRFKAKIFKEKYEVKVEFLGWGGVGSQTNNNTIYWGYEYYFLEQQYIWLYYCERFEPRSHYIVQVEVVLNSTVAFDSNRLVLCTKWTMSLRILLTITSCFS